jgi:hypothetical protein
MSSRTCISREEEIAAGFIAAKGLLIILFCGSAEGHCQMEPLMVYHLENARALKVYPKTRLLVA